MEKLILIKEYQQVMMKAYTRSDRRLYMCNRAYEICLHENGLSVLESKTPSTYHKNRKPLTLADLGRRSEISAKLMAMDNSNKLRYYIDHL